jgi:hypothetical protein
MSVDHQAGRLLEVAKASGDTGPTFRTPPLQVHDLGHLGLVASVLDRIRLVETVDRLVGPRPGEKVATGMALKTATLKVFP